MDPPPTLRHDARRFERGAIVAAGIALLAVVPGLVHPLAIPEIVLGGAAVLAACWRLARQRPEQGWYALGVAIVLQLAVLAIWVVPARSFLDVLWSFLIVGIVPGAPLVTAFLLADRARTARRLAWGREQAEMLEARTYSRLTAAPPGPPDDEWAFADRALEAHEDDLAFLDRAAASAPRRERPDEELPPAARLVGMPATVARAVSPRGIGAVHVVHRGVRLEVVATCASRVPVGRDVVIVGAATPTSVIVRPREGPDVR